MQISKPAKATYRADYLAVQTKRSNDVPNNAGDQSGVLWVLVVDIGWWISVVDIGSKILVLKYCFVGECMGCAPRAWCRIAGAI